MAEGGPSPRRAGGYSPRAARTPLPAPEAPARSPASGIPVPAAGGRPSSLPGTSAGGGRRSPLARVRRRRRGDSPRRHTRPVQCRASARSIQALCCQRTAPPARAQRPACCPAPCQRPRGVGYGQRARCRAPATGGTQTMLGAGYESPRDPWVPKQAGEVPGGSPSPPCPSGVKRWVPSMHEVGM